MLKSITRFLIICYLLKTKKEAKKFKELEISVCGQLNV